jgi:REP element-mobilizing transposase RayT
MFRPAAGLGGAMSHAFSKLLCHCTFSTKQRRPLLTPQIGDRVNRYLAGIARESHMHLLRGGGVADHRHLLLELKPAMSVSDAMRLLKTNSSRWLRENFPEGSDFSWQEGYAAFSVSMSAAEEVVAYIDRQESHHRRMTFEEELKALLDRHKVAYDAQHVFD